MIEDLSLFSINDWMSLLDSSIVKARLDFNELDNAESDETMVLQ